MLPVNNQVVQSTHHNTSQPSQSAAYAEYEQQKAAYDKALYEHQLQLMLYHKQLEYLQQAATAPTSPSSLNQSGFYDNDFPPPGIPPYDFSQVVQHNSYLELSSLCCI